MAMFNRYSLQAISIIVEEFYRRVLASQNLSLYFEGVDISKLREHQAELISHVMGGPITYSGRALSTAHARLTITDQDFSEVTQILEETLLDGGVASKDVNEIMRIVSGHRKDIVKQIS
jgi:hemoglobin